MTPSNNPGAHRRAGQVKLQETDEILTKLGQCGEVLFSEAETATAMNTSHERLSAFLQTKPQARQAYESGRLRTLEALRRAQFKHAQTSASMAIYLGRTYFGQAEQREDGDGEAFDLEGATRRLRDKLGALVAAPDPVGDRTGGP